jgi:hypothetical protein
MPEKEPKRPNNNAKALENWESEGGAPASDDRHQRCWTVSFCRALQHFFLNRRLNVPVNDRFHGFNCNVKVDY